MRLLLARRHRTLLKLVSIATLGATAALALGSGPAAAQRDGIIVTARRYVDDALAAQRAGRFDEAIELYDKAYALAPHPTILFNLGQAHRLKGDKATALVYYRKYLVANPDGSLTQEAHVWAAQLHEEILAEQVRRAEDALEAKRGQPTEAGQKSEEAPDGGPSRLADLQRTTPRAPPDGPSRRETAAPPTHGREDAGATSNFLMPTALTSPGGSFGLHSYDLLVVGASYAPTDRLLLSITLAPSSLGDGLLALVSGKAQLVRGDRLHLAVQGAAFLDAAGGDSSFAGTVGAVATLCLDLACASHASTYGALGYVHDTTTAVVAAGLMIHLFWRVKLLLEADGVFLSDVLNEDDEASLFWYGLRLAWPRLSGNVGLVKPLSADAFFVSEAKTQIGIPFVSVTYRLR